jgi:5-methylcytosine-specific restriction endonuclease McrA
MNDTDIYEIKLLLNSGFSVTFVANLFGIAKQDVILARKDNSNRNNEPLKTTKICLVCGTEYRKKVPKQKYCSRECFFSVYGKSKYRNLSITEKNRAYSRNYYYNNKDLFRLRQRERDLKLTPAIPILNLREHVKRFHGICVYCGKPGNSIDHVMPLSKGGKHEISNLVIACLPCNIRKSNKIIDPKTVRLDNFF